VNLLLQICDYEARPLVHLDQVKIYRLTDGRYGQASVLSLEAQDQLPTPLLPALSLPLATLFEVNSHA
jgi:hypothetical protein